MSAVVFIQSLFPPTCIRKITLDRPTLDAAPCGSSSPFHFLGVGGGSRTAVAALSCVPLQVRPQEGHCVCLVLIDCWVITQ